MSTLLPLENLKPGPEGRTFDESILRELVHIRVVGQVPWTELPDKYMELLPADSMETRPDHRTLRKEIMKNSDIMAMPTRVHKGMKSRLIQEYDKADLGVMMMDVLMSKYGEWNLLHSKMLRYVAASSVQGEDLEGVSVFTSAERKRMDKLGEDVLSIVFRIGEMMRGMSITDNNLFVLLEQVRGGQMGMETAGGQQMDSIAMSVSKVLAEVKEASERMLSDVNERHKALGMGHHRPKDNNVVVDLIDDG